VTFVTPGAAMPGDCRTASTSAMKRCCKCRYRLHSETLQDPVVDSFWYALAVGGVLAVGNVFYALVA
jgi:hypothetical protein